MTARRDLGDFGERIARHHLEAAGIAVVDANVRLSAGEIDLVGRERDETVFVEVRTRRAGLGMAAQSVTPRKVDRMWRCAFEYCELHAIDPGTARVDAVVIDLDGGGAVLAVEHLRALEMPG